MKRPLILVAAVIAVGALVVAAPLSASAATPVITITAPVSITNDTTPVSPFSGDSIADADNDTLSVSVSWTNGGTVGGSASPVSTSGDPATVTTWLTALVYTPAVGVTTTATFTISVDDGGGPVTDSSVSVQVTAVAVDLHIGASGTGTYGGAATVSPVYSGGMTGVDTSGVVCASTTTATDAAGTYATAGQCSGAVSQAGFNYNFIYDFGPVVIGKAPLTVTASNESGMYGSLPTPTAGYAGLVNGETSVAGITCTTVSPVVPSAPTRCSGTAANYAVTFVDGTATITQAPLTITPSNAQATYGGVAPVTATPLGLVAPSVGAPVDTMAALSTQPTCTTSAGATAHVGGYPATTTCAGAVATNYAITYGAPGTTTITPASLTITALGKSRLVGQPNGAFSATTVGFVNGQTLANLTGTLGFSTAATVSSGPGSYPVQPSGVSSTDYAISFVPGIVTVTAVAPTPTPTPTATITPKPSPTPTPSPTRTSTPTPTPDPVPASNDLGWLPWVIGVAGVVFIAAVIGIIVWRRRAV